MDGRNDSTGPDSQDRAQRLAEALRENLRRRKAQARARRGGAGIGEAAAEDRPDPETKSGETT